LLADTISIGLNIALNSIQQEAEVFEIDIQLKEGWK
jgi:hypothetical protein